MCAQGVFTVCSGHFVGFAAAQLSKDTHIAARQSYYTLHLRSFLALAINIEILVKYARIILRYDYAQAHTQRGCGGAITPL